MNTQINTPLAAQHSPSSEPPSVQQTSKAIRLEIENLNKKIVDLQSVAAAARKEELADVIKQVRLMLSEYEMTEDEISVAFSVPSGHGRVHGAKGASVRYIGPNGEQWGGGRGPRPRWVVEALRTGHMLEEFSVTAEAVMLANNINSTARLGVGRWRPAVAS